MTPDKDRADLRSSDSRSGWTGSRLSFVQRPEDIAEVKKVARGARFRFWAQSWKSRRLWHGSTRSWMSPMPSWWARGDLGVEMPLEKVPGLQKAHHPAMPRRAGKPVIVDDADCSNR